MGLGEVSTVPECESLTTNEKTDYSEGKLKKLRLPPVNYKTVCSLNVVFLVVIFGLIAALIVVRFSDFLDPESVYMYTRVAGRVVCSEDFPEAGESEICHVVDTEVLANTSALGDEKQNLNPVPCKDDWIWYRGKCYYFSKERDTWNNSLRFCRSYNASLVLIDNQEEVDFLFRFKGLDNHWIGLRRKDDDKTWIWTNGTLYNESLFPIKRLSQNSGEIEHVCLNHEGVISQEGTYEYKWICNLRN